MYLDPRAGALPCYRTVIHPPSCVSLEETCYMQPGPRRTQVQHISEDLCLLEEGPPPLVVDCTSLAQMARKVPLLYERRQHPLGQRRGVSVGSVFSINERANERL